MTRDFEIIGEFNDFKDRINQCYNNDALALAFFQEWTELRDVAGLNDE